jgi:hypothetical protein
MRINPNIAEMLKFTRKSYYNKCYKIYTKFKKLIKMNEKYKYFNI